MVQHFVLDINSGLWKPVGDFGECGERLGNSHIVGGKAAQLGEFPWMALLGYAPWKKSPDIAYLCAGSVINKHYVLTAAHCIHTSSGYPV